MAESLGADTRQETMNQFGKDIFLHQKEVVGQVVLAGSAVRCGHHRHDSIPRLPGSPPGGRATVGCQGFLSLVLPPPRPGSNLEFAPLVWSELV